MIKAQQPAALGPNPASGCFRSAAYQAAEVSRGGRGCRAHKREMPPLALRGICGPRGQCPVLPATQPRCRRLAGCVAAAGLEVVLAVDRRTQGAGPGSGGPGPGLELQCVPREPQFFGPQRSICPMGIGAHSPGFLGVWPDCRAPASWVQLGSGRLAGAADALVREARVLCPAVLAQTSTSPGRRAAGHPVC